MEKPRLYLDEGEFIWTDGGYGHGPHTVAPYTNIRAEEVQDLRTFNYNQSLIRGRAEHGIAYLKQRFQMLMGYRGNIYREKDERGFSKIVMACIVAHTVASKHDQPNDVGYWLTEEGSTDAADIGDTVNYLQRMQVQASQGSYRSAYRNRQEAQRQFQRQCTQEAATLSATAKDRLRKKRALDLREEMHAHLFEDMNWKFVDTTEDSRRGERAG